MIFLWCWPWCVFELNVHLPISTVATFLKCQIITSIVTNDVIHRHTWIFPAIDLFTGWLHHVDLLIVEAREFCLSALFHQNAPVLFCNRRSLLSAFYCWYGSEEYGTIHFRLHMITLFRGVILIFLGLRTITAWRHSPMCQQPSQCLFCITRLIWISMWEQSVRLGQWNICPYIRSWSRNIIAAAMLNCKYHFLCCGDLDIKHSLAVAFGNSNWILVTLHGPTVLQHLCSTENIELTCRYMFYFVNCFRFNITARLVTQYPRDMSNHFCLLLSIANSSDVFSRVF